MTSLPERVLQFGTGRLLRALCCAAVDTANRAGAFGGSIVVVQSTPDGVADLINRQQGEFYLAEFGVEHGAMAQRAVRIDAISRALVADAQWGEVRDIIAQPELRVIVSNVTEAGFRLDDDEPPFDAARTSAPHSYPAKLVDLLFTRYTRLPDGPSLLVIPTELVDDNGPRLAAMVDALAVHMPASDAFRAWVARTVRFASSLVDRITTGMPSDTLRSQIERQLGASDPLLTATEAYMLWAIEGDPAALRETFPIDEASGGAVIFAPDISYYRQRKLRVLNGAHTALAPFALRLNVRTVGEAVGHPKIGPLLAHLLFAELAPVLPGNPEESHAYAATILERFANPSLEHEWRVIATNQTAKMRLRLVPTIVDAERHVGGPPAELTALFAIGLLFACDLAVSDGEGWWSADGYRIVDVDRHLVNAHWLRVRPAGLTGKIPADIMQQFAESVLGDVAIWGLDLLAFPAFVGGVARSLFAFQPGYH